MHDKRWLSPSNAWAIISYAEILGGEMMTSLTIGSISVRPGSKARTILGSIRSPSGSTAGIPCIVANGVEEGPTLVVSGGNPRQRDCRDSRDHRAHARVGSAADAWRVDRHPCRQSAGLLIKPPTSLRRMGETWHRAFIGTQILKGR